MCLSIHDYYANIKSWFAEINSWWWCNSASLGVICFVSLQQMPWLLTSVLYILCFNKVKKKREKKNMLNSVCETSHNEEIKPTSTKHDG